MLQRQMLWEWSCSREHSILPRVLPANLHVAPLPCTSQHSVELLMMGPLFTAVFLFKQLEKLKDQLSNEDGSEVAYALESLSASQPKKRGRF